VLININRQRASLILSHLFDENLDAKPLSHIPTPLEISKQERLFRNNKILSKPSHTADIGVPSTAVFNLMKGQSIFNSPLKLGPTSSRNDALHAIFADEDYVLWFQRTSKSRVHVLISLSSNSFKAHFRAWAHAYVLAKLVSGGPFDSSKSDAQMLEKKVGEVAQALTIVNAAFEQGIGIERTLMSKGWDIERSMMCPHVDGINDWTPMMDEKAEDIIKRE